VQQETVSSRETWVWKVVVTQGVSGAFVDAGLSLAREVLDLGRTHPVIDQHMTGNQQPQLRFLMDLPFGYWVVEVHWGLMGLSWLFL